MKTEAKGLKIGQNFGSLIQIYRARNTEERILIFLFSIISCVVLQLAMNNPDYGWFLEKNEPFESELTVEDGFELVDDAYVTYSGFGTLSLSLPEQAISGLMIEFAQPVHEAVDLNIHTVWLEHGFNKKQSYSSLARHNANFFYIPLDSVDYQEISLELLRITIEESDNARNYVMTEKNPNVTTHTPHSEYSSTILESTHRQIYIKSVFFLEDQLSMPAKILGNLRLADSVLYLCLFFLFFIHLFHHKVKTWKYTPFIVVFLVFLFYFNARTLKGDDLFLFFPQISYYNIFEYSVMHYKIWNSRFLIEIFPYYLVHSYPLWAILSASLSVLCCYCLSKLWTKESSFFRNLLIATLFLCCPITTFGEVGWIATTCNYLWVATAILYSFLLIAKDLRGERITKPFYYSSLFAALYGSNQEQGAALMLGFYLLFGAYYLWKKKSMKPWILQVLITIANLLNHLFCSGNLIRGESSISAYFHNFPSLSIFQKLEIGFSTSLLYIFSNGTLLLSLLLGFMILLSCVRLKKQAFLPEKKALMWYARPILYGLPVLLYVQFATKDANTYAYSILTQSMTETGTNPSFQDIGSLLPLFAMIFLFASLLLAVFFSFQKKESGLFAVIILCAGLCSRMVMGFSPTIWVIEHHRTYIFFYFCILFVLLMLFEELLPQIKKKQEEYYIYGFCILGLVQVYQLFMV